VMLNYGPFQVLFLWVLPRQVSVFANKRSHSSRQ